jgi:septum site-determining protein MinC
LLLSGRQTSVTPGDHPPAAAETPAPAPFSDSTPDAAATLPNDPSPPDGASSAPTVVVTSQQPNSLLLESPVRSGQCIVHPEGDVIVVGSVASGAEVIAGGSIHIYGTLRGRAIAGSRDPRARIFCRKFEAELLSIDGLYMVADEMPAHLRGQPIRVWLEGDSMMMAQD